MVIIFKHTIRLYSKFLIYFQENFLKATRDIPINFLSPFLFKILNKIIKKNLLYIYLFRYNFYYVYTYHINMFMKTIPFKYFLLTRVGS